MTDTFRDALQRLPIGRRSRLASLLDRTGGRAWRSRPSIRVSSTAPSTSSTCRKPATHTIGSAWPPKAASRRSRRTSASPRRTCLTTSVASLEVLMDVLQRPVDMSARAVVPGPRPPLAPPGQPPRDPGRLPARQLDVLTFVARGWPNRDIARRLGLEEESVRNYLSNAYKNLHVRSRTEAALVMVRHGYGADP